jgi:FO synthase
MTDDELLGAPLDELMALARQRREAYHGRIVTYSPKVFIPLTQLCRNRCGYCTFAKAPRHVASPYLELDAVVELATRGAEAGCKEALFTLGERPELRYAHAAQWLEVHGAASTVEYLAEACRAVLERTGLLPHANAGALHQEELALLRRVSASQGMMLESLNPRLACHRGAPDKAPARRLATLTAAGELSIPFTTGVLVGIGEDRGDRIEALRAIAASHARYGHVQEVIVQNFLPKPGTAMRGAPPCPPEEHLWTVAVARLVLPGEVHVQAPPNLIDDPLALLEAGIDDFGGVSPITIDHVNPERAWPAVSRLRLAARHAGVELVARLAVHPEYVRDASRWLDEAVVPAVLAASDALGFAREDPWVAGGTAPPPDLLRPPGPNRSVLSRAAPRSRPTRIPCLASREGRGTRVQEVLEGVSMGQEPGEEELVALFEARGDQVLEVAALADELRRRIAGEVVTYVVNRNINYTNVCTFRCRFCAFSKGPRSLNLRGDPYLLELEEIARRVAEAEEAGATEVCLQGGIHPSFDGEYYLSVLHAVRQGSARIHIHAFSALEVYEGARRLGEPLESYLRRLKAAGLSTLPGTAAEILDDEVRAVLCPDKITTEQWLEVHRVAHEVGLRSNVTIMFGSVERPRSWARHIVATRELQRRTGGFTEFVPLPFVHMGAPIFLAGRARRGPTFREAILMHAVARIAYGALVANIQTSWVKMGAAGARQALMAGANDLGGTLMDENISRAAGAAHGQRMDVEDFARIVAPIGRPLAQRTTLYGRVPALAVG